MDRKYVSSFVDDGLLYMNTIDYFRSYEEEDEDLRADKHEGLSASYLPSEIKMTLEDGRPIKGVLGKVDSRPLIGNFVNIYCMVVITEDDISNGYELDQRFSKFGGCAVVIDENSISKFFHRVLSKIDSDLNFSSIDPSLKVAGLVNYVDRDLNLPRLTAFNKFNNYEWQKEFRIVVGRETGQGPLSNFKIGDLSSLAKVYETSELLKHGYPI
jgi:hypothetical protein